MSSQYENKIDLTTPCLGRRPPSNIGKEIKQGHSELTLNDTWRRSYIDVTYLCLNLNSELIRKTSFRIGI